MITFHYRGGGFNLSGIVKSFDLLKYYVMTAGTCVPAGGDKSIPVVVMGTFNLSLTPVGEAPIETKVVFC